MKSRYRCKPTENRPFSSYLPRVGRVNGFPSQWLVGQSATPYHKSTMSDSNAPAVVPTPEAKTKLEVAGLTVEVSPKTAKMIRTVENKSGGIRVSLIPATSKDGGPSMKKLGLTGQAAKAALKRAKREIGGAMFAAMSNCVTTGKLGWRSTTLTKTGTFGVFFDQGDAEDTAALSEAEARADKAEAELAALKAKLSDADKAALQAELAAA